MDAVALLLIACAAIAILGALAEVLFERAGVPEALWLVGCGVLLGPGLGLLEAVSLASMTGPLVLTFALFELGVRVKPEGLRACPRAALVAAAAWSVSIAVTAAVSMLASLAGALPIRWSWLDALLLGVLLASPSARLVGRTLARSAGDAATTDLAGQEARLSEVASLAAASVLLQAKATTASGALARLVDVVGAVSIATAGGLMAAVLLLVFLRLLRSAEHAYPVALAGMLVLWVTVGQSGGSAALAVLVCSVSLGLSPMLRDLVPWVRPVNFDADPQGFGRLARFLARSALFLVAGLVLTGPWATVLVGGLLGVVLLGARVAAVRLALLHAQPSPRAAVLLGVCVSRGMLPIAFAFTCMPTLGAGGPELAQVTIVTVVATIALFALAYPLARGKAARSTLVSVELPSGTTQVKVPMIAPDAAARQAMSSDREPIEQLADVQEAPPRAEVESSRDRGTRQ